jgi:hypothetical protein
MEDNGKKKLHTYRRLIAATNSLENRIDELEQQLTLAAMGIEPFLTRYEQDLKNWKTDFGAHQVDLHQEIAKEFNTCILTIFGSSPENYSGFTRPSSECRVLNGRQPLSGTET